MVIIYARMRGYDWVSTPSDAVARELEKLGHKVLWVESLDYLPITKADVVFSPYESVTLVGDAISKKLNIPHYSHVEVLPPWRVKENIDFANYGLSRDDPEIASERLASTIPHYMMVGKAWKNAHMKSVSNHCRVDFHHKLLGKVDDLLIRYPSVDVVSIETAQRMYSPKRQDDKVITVSRAMPIKRYDLLMQVMNKIKSKVTWTVIGDGTMLEVLKQGVTNPKVKLDIRGGVWGWERYYEIMTSKLMIYAMGGMPPLEAALLGTFPIVIENPPTDDLPEFDKFMRYNHGFKKDNYQTTFYPIFQHDQIDEMADKVDEELAKPAGQSVADNAIKTAFMCGSMNVTSSKANASQLIERIEVYLANN